MFLYEKLFIAQSLFPQLFLRFNYARLSIEIAIKHRTHVKITIAFIRDISTRPKVRRERSAKARLRSIAQVSTPRRDSAKSTASTVKVDKRVAHEHRIPRLPQPRPR